MWIAGVLIAGCSNVRNPSQNESSGSTSGVLLALTPTTATDTVEQPTLFQATVTGATNTAVTWEVNGAVGGNSMYGTISGSQFVAPATVPNPANRRSNCAGQPFRIPIRFCSDCGCHSESASAEHAD
jgi:hypothetical protein